TANLLSCGEWRPFCRPAKTARYRNYGDAAPVVLLSGRENRSASLRPRLCRELLWDSLLLQASERNLKSLSFCQQRDISSLPPPIPMITGVEEKDLWEKWGVLCGQWHHGKSSVTPLPSVAGSSSKGGLTLPLW
ncbi:hypothetical protein ILYODFUR_021664, partial [Ilyodon furcidens]